VGVAEEADDGVDFKVRLEELNEELETLNSDAKELQERIGKNISNLLK
jgi:type I restriction enzyme M protein